MKSRRTLRTQHHLANESFSIFDFGLWIFDVWSGRLRPTLRGPSCGRVDGVVVCVLSSKNIVVVGSLQQWSVAVGYFVGRLVVDSYGRNGYPVVSRNDHGAPCWVVFPIFLVCAGGVLSFFLMPDMLIPMFTKGYFVQALTPLFQRGSAHHPVTCITRINDKLFVLGQSVEALCCVWLEDGEGMAAHKKVTLQSLLLRTTLQGLAENTTMPPGPCG